MDRKTCTSGSVTKMFAILLIICLVECATEQVLNNRGSKSSNLFEKIGGWRSQRGGSCLSYGHSCWGAHGKRSGKPPASAPDWYLDRILRRMAANAEMNRAKTLASKNQDDDAIYELGVQDDSSTLSKMSDDNGPVDSSRRNLEAKPMLDDDLLAKMKIWQIMRESSEQN